MTDIHFGTDGWRGRIAEDYTFDNVRRAAQGFANYLGDLGHEGADVVVGHDRAETLGNSAQFNVHGAALPTRTRTPPTSLGRRRCVCVISRRSRASRR